MNISKNNCLVLLFLQKIEILISQPNNFDKKELFFFRKTPCKFFHSLPTQNIKTQITFLDILYRENHNTFNFNFLIKLSIKNDYFSLL